MTSYTMLSGECVELPALEPRLEDFLAQARVKANDPTVTVSAMVDLLYGEGNPLLQRGIIDGRGVVTREAFAHPAYLVLLDLLDHKRIQQGTLDPNAARSAYQVSVAEAARQLGVSSSAVRQAIAVGKLPSERRGKLHFLRQADIDTYEVGAQGPTHSASPSLSLVMGSDSEGRSLSVRFDPGARLERGGSDGGVLLGELVDWSRVAIKTTTHDGTVRYFVLAPTRTAVQTLAHGPRLRVRGRFEIVDKINHPRRATEAWKAFLPDEDANAGV